MHRGQLRDLAVAIPGRLGLQVQHDSHGEAEASGAGEQVPTA